ncbi:MAG TPA: type II toxin-antitoxin system VapC family toxin [Thermoanaerobaculia bacterium]|nr:type II toxin-antitoxin system VapC family toxin [Thermoanaerobaculia bacterium]
MSVVVLDASAAVELLRASRTGRQVARVLRGKVVAAPGHLDAEVLSALGRLARAADLAPERVERSLAELARAPVRRFPVPPLLAAAWALRANLSLRDALYVALARRLEANLVTADARLARAPDLGIALTVVG